LQSVGAEPIAAEAEVLAIEETASRKLVLPRFLRKPVRALLRKDWKMPRAVGLKGMAVLFLSTAAAGVLIGGHSMTVAAAITSWSGLGIDEVEITGQSETSEVDVLDALGIGEFPSLVTFNVEAARAGVEALPWVKEARIKKLYPDTVQVAVVERTPFAIWQHDGKVSLIDRDGRVITDTVSDRYATLPFVVGAGAEKRAAEYSELIAGVPSLKIHAGVLISDRRWNVVLDGGVELLLPEADPSSALVAVAALDSDNGLLSRDIAAVDLRLPNRLVVRLSETGNAAWQTILKERETLAKKGKST
jgi:cell division protein FtsQ